MCIHEFLDAYAGIDPAPQVLQEDIIMDQEPVIPLVSYITDNDDLNTNEEESLVAIAEANRQQPDSDIATPDNSVTEVCDTITQFMETTYPSHTA